MAAIAFLLGMDKKKALRSGEPVCAGLRWTEGISNGGKPTFPVEGWVHGMLSSLIAVEQEYRSVHDVQIIAAHQDLSIGLKK